MSKRVYELASILGLSNKQTVELLWENNIDVKNHMSVVDDQVQDKLLNILLLENNSISHYNNSSLKFVEINGLFYKHDYKINLDKDINILIAENGFGKTTILNIIVATLKQDINKLNKLPFKSIKFGFNNISIEISKDELNDSISKNEVRNLLIKARNYIPEITHRRLMDKYMIDEEIDIEEIHYLIRKYSDRLDVYGDISNPSWSHRSKKGRVNGNKKLEEKFKIIESAVKEQLLYFPTYRRIEEELGNFIKLTNDEKRRFQSKFDSNVINFGMEDVENIITELTNKLREDAINYYSIMNGEILDDLLTNRLTLTNKEKRKIDVDKIKIVVGRIGENRIKQLDKLMNFINNDSGVENKNFLEYYLFKLINIYESQKVIDEKIKKYRDVCNKYLVNKKIIYDEVLTQVRIVDNDTLEELSFSELSSGEKQILSLFSRLYLKTSKPVIFIIDEPELSLSITWQKRLLEDIYDSGRIALMISTTHSPFIFQNKFRTFAKELKVFRKGDLNE